MLPKPERLKDRQLFKLVLSLGKKKKQRIGSDLFLLYYFFKKKDINELPKTAFVVGLSVDKKSNKRNLIKRRMRAAYQLVRKSLVNLIKSRFSVLIWIASPAVKNATFKQIENSMKNLLTKVAHEKLKQPANI